MLQDSSVSCSNLAEEWLLDNADFIEEQVLVVKQQLNRLCQHPAQAPQDR